MAKHMTVKSFVEAIEKWAKKKTHEVTEERFREVYLSCFQGLITQSPVDKGTFRLSWFPAVGSPSTEVAPEEEGKKPSSFAADRTEPIPSNFRIGHTLYIGNALPYAENLESGWSKKAPQGVVAPTKRAVELAIERDKNKKR